MPDTLSEDDWFERLVKHAKTGEVLNLRPTNLRPTFANPAHSDLWPADRAIPANAIRRILTLPEPDMKSLHPDGLRIRGARIDGYANWNRIVFPRQLAFGQCGFASTIKLVGARISTLGLAGCALPGVNLDAAHIDGGVAAHKLTVHGETRAVGAHISGQLNLSGARLSNPNDRALVLDSSRISTGLMAKNLTVVGDFLAVGTQISGQFNLHNATLTNPNGRALNLDGAHVEGTIFAGKLTVHGETRAVGAHISGQLNLHDAVLTNTDSNAKALTFEGARIGNQVDLSRAILTNTKGQALTFDGAHIDSDLFASGLTVNGEVRAIDARIAGELSLSDATLIKPLTDSTALTLARTHIESGLNTDGMKVDGEITAIRAHISGGFDLTGSIVTNRGGDALVLESATVDQLILLPRKFTGNIHLDLAKIGTLTVPPKSAPGNDRRTEALLDATLSATGWSVAELRGSLLQDWTVARSFLERTLDPEPGSENIDQSSMSFPRFIRHAKLRRTERQFVPEPWFVIADVYERIGQPEQARRMRLHTEKQVTKHTRGTTKKSRLIHAATVGYGYRPFRPAVWLIGVLVAAGLLIWTNQSRFLNASAKSPITANDVCTDTSGYPCFNTIAYTLQNVVPAAAGPLRLDWALSTSGWWPITLGVTLAVLRLVAWGFAALTLAAMTGLIRKR